MISFKKSYAEQMLQLALALSLLQVDPRDYLSQGWDSQLEMRNGDGWQLEMLRAVPISEYPYANRKAMMPLIEDLVRFDRQNIQDITTYLLNVQNAQNNYTSVQDQENSVSSGGGSNGIGGTVGNSAPLAIEQPTSISETSNSIVHEIDLFLNPQHFEEEASIVDQNLADLGEFGDFSLSTFPYFGLPLKDEPPEEFSVPDIVIKQEVPSTSSAFNVHEESPSTSTNYSGIVTEWDEVTDNNFGTETDDIDIKNIHENVEIKQELENENKEDKNEEIKDQESKSSHKNESLSSTIVKTEEESEIVEVLWKQDVDLGYSLTPPKLTSNSAETSSLSSSSSKNLDDEVEKLKALEELKLDKIKDDDSSNTKNDLDDDVDDEWAGIPFRIDNETGEYIRQPSLQLDEILQEVLQLGDLTTDDQEESIIIKEDFSEDNKQKQINFSADDTDLLTNSIVNGSTATIEPPQSEVEISSLPSPLFDFEDASELDAELDMMIQSTVGPFQHHRTGQNYGATNSAFRQSGFHHHHHHQSRVPLSRGLSMEQRLQDIANLFNPIPGMSVGMGVGEMSPYSHYPTHYPYQASPNMPPQHGQFPHHAPHPVLHNSALADIGTGQPHYGHNLGSAVSSSMHLTNSTHETDAGAAGYKTDPEMMYYSNTSSELNHTTDGFINSILNDEDLQLMDMGVNESFCGMRMLDSNTTSNNSSVLGSASATSHSSNHLLSTTMPTSLGPLGTSTATGNEALGSTGDRLDASSDSAVSSMGSERVPSLSDGEWGDAGSDSAQEYHHGKYGGPYDYSYNNRLGDGARQPVAQKKHQMFGKRYFQEQPTIPGGLTHPPNTSHQQTGSDHMVAPVKYEYEPYSLHHPPSVGAGHNLEGAVGPIVGKDHLPMMPNTDMKYPCSLDFSVRTPRTAHDIINHNHSYTLPQGTGSTPRPQIRDKKQKKIEDEHLTRDEKRARALNIPISVNDIINLPMDEFNERLSKYDLTENQLSLIRDIRRRGKNKVAAQNCRKRKLDQILSLEDEVKEVRRRKDRLYQERDAVVTERKRIANKFAALHRHVFQYLRDSDGNPCSPSQYSLQQAADGSVYLLRRENKKPDGNNGNTSNSGTNAGSNSNTAGPNHTHNNINGTSHHHHHHHHHHHLSQGPPNVNHQKE